MTLYIDDREKSMFLRLVQQKAKKMNIKTKVERIEVGDYVIGDVCFEAKSTQDFMTSLFSKRLWTQLDNMDRCFGVNFVIVYGSIEEACEVGNHMKGFDKMPAGSKAALLENKFRGAITRIELDSDIQVIWTRNENEAAQRLITIAKMAPIERQVIKPTIHKRISTNDVRVDMLATVKGISEKKAKDLLNQFGSIMEVGECNINELCFIDGMGEIVSKRLSKVLNSEERVML
tara:strand:+ start:5177 stop:5872 length:696 start_codon:yes stop_codon:yes gene_type:complete